jgi:hypothetical protein
MRTSRNPDDFAAKSVAGPQPAIIRLSVPFRGSVSIEAQVCPLSVDTVESAVWHETGGKVFENSKKSRFFF